MKKENLFRWATSELSQDAIICWLLQWAGNNEERNNPLKDVGVKIITRLTDGKITQIDSIKIKRQHHKIDIVCFVNESDIILIEDKTNTKNHSNQLERYLQTLKKLYPDFNIYPIYFKTGDQSDYYKILAAGYKTFLRNDFIDVLNFGIQNGVTNSILIDYYAYLKNIEDQIQSYKTKPINKWDNSCWIGFFKNIKSSIDKSNWNYVAQKNGGFYAFHWHWNGASQNDIKFNYYLQIEGSKKIRFRIKLHVDDKINAQAVRSYFWNNIKHFTENTDLNLKKNGRVGKYMTIAEIQNKWLITDINNIIKIEDTIDEIKRISLVFSEINNIIHSTI